MANNWHLFDTMDVRKFTTGEVVHRPTQPMEDASPTDLHIACYDILDDTLPIPTSPGWVTWGIAETDNFRIGMIRCDRWVEQAETYWEAACNTMVQDGDLDGLIIDFRTNMGGNTIDFGMRSDPDDHMAMSRLGNTLHYRIWSESSTYFGKPIAVLLGPKAISSGDQVALRMPFHPMAKTFGQPTSGTFDAPVNHPVPDQSQFYGRYSEANACFWNVPDEYLSSCGVPVDYPFWLELPEKREVSLQIYDVAGRRVRSLLSRSPMTAGSHGVDWDGLDSQGRAVSAGVYFFGVRAGNDREFGRVMLLK